jgi:uncharacterized protein
MIIDSYFDSVIQEFTLDEEYQTLNNYFAHGSISVYSHSLFVAERSYLYAKKKNLDLDYRSLIRGAMLHDFYLYDWHKKHKGHRLHGFRHPAWALHNALLRFPLNLKERNIIRSHMFPLTLLHPPLSKEARIVCHMDHYEARVEYRMQNVVLLQKAVLSK